MLKNSEFYVINGSDDRYDTYDLTLLVNDISKLPKNIQVGSSASYTDPRTNELHIYKLTSEDGSAENKVWVEI